MSDVTIVFAVVGIMVVLFLTNRVPVALAALSGTLMLYFTGILDRAEALKGFGDPAVLFIASLFVVSASLDASGVTAWVGQVLIRRAGHSRNWLMVLMMLLVGTLTALIGVSGAVAALLPVVIMVAVRLRRPPSALLMPLVFGAHAGSMLVLTGSLVNVLLSNAAIDAGLPGFGYFELSVIGVPLLAGTIAIVVLFGDRLMPVRSSRSIPEDFSRHPRTLSDQYNVPEGLSQLEITARSPYVGMSRRSLEDEQYPGLLLIHVQTKNARGPVDRPLVEPGDTVLVHGEAAAVERFAGEKHLAQQDSDAADIRSTLFNNVSGFAEVVIPPRSGLIGQAMFPGMITESRDLIILGIQRRGENVGPGEVVLAPGDTLLLQGSWKALEEHLSDPDVLVVDEPDLVRRQTATLGPDAQRALAVLSVMVVMLATGAQPNVITGMVAASAMVLLRVLTIERAFRAISGTSLIMIASLIPFSTAMYKTGAAALMAHALVELLGSYSGNVVLAGLFALTALSAQLISSTATALIVIPVAVAAAAECGISPRAALVTVAVAAAACFLSPVASSANIMVQGPGGYRFGDYWRLGLPLMLWFFVVATFVVPLIWHL